METKFFLSSHDFINDPVPRECSLIKECTVIQTKQKLYCVQITPKLIMCENNDSKIKTIFIGMIEKNSSGNSGKQNILVDIYYSVKTVTSEVISSTNLVRLGIGMIHNTFEQAEFNSPIENLRQPENFVANDLLFIGEQDGISELELKRQLIDYFLEQKLCCRAYLARIKYNNQEEICVALCLKLKWKEKPYFKSDIGIIFSELFKQDQHLDVLVINAEQDDQLSKVCNPFFDNF